MAVAEASTPRAEVRVPQQPGAPIGLRGEFDLFELRPLREALDGLPETGAPIRVDLSGVTFLDASCARELMIHSFPQGGRLTLSNPSQEAGRTLKVCTRALPGVYVRRTEDGENGGYAST